MEEELKKIEEIIEDFIEDYTCRMIDWWIDGREDVLTARDLITRLLNTGLITLKSVQIGKK